MPASQFRDCLLGGTRTECIPWKDLSVPHRINSLICLTLGLCLWTQFAQAQSSIPRPASGTRPATQKSPVPAAGQKAPATSVPRIAREPVGNATLADEPAENAEPQRKPAGPFPKQGAMQGPDPQQPAGECGRHHPAESAGAAALGTGVTNASSALIERPYTSRFLARLRGPDHAAFSLPRRHH